MIEYASSTHSNLLSCLAVLMSWLREPTLLSVSTFDCKLKKQLPTIKCHHHIYTYSIHWLNAQLTSLSFLEHMQHGGPDLYNRSLPCAHAQGGKVIGVIIVSTKIAKSQYLGTWATRKRLESVTFGKKVVFWLTSPGPLQTSLRIDFYLIITTSHTCTQH